MSSLAPSLLVRSGAGIRRLVLTSRGQALLAFAGYLIFAIWLTWPMLKNPGHLFYGGAGDPFGALSGLREMLDEHKFPFLPGTLTDFNAPDGLPVAWVRNLAALPSVLTLYLLGLAFGPVAAYNFFALAAGPLTGLATFLLARRLSGSAWASAIAGWAFAYFPFAVMKDQGHYELAHGWVLIIAVWRVLELLEQPTRRNGVLAGLGVVLAMAWTQYFILLGGVAYATLAMGGLVLAWRHGKLRRQIPAQAITAAIVLAYLVTFYTLNGTTATGQGLRNNNAAQLNTYSARPLEYLIPDKDHPLFGRLTGNWLQHHLHGSNFSESTLYVGISILLFALVGVVAALRGRVAPPVRRAALLLSALAFVAVAVSGPPEATLFGHLLPTPSKLITSVTTTWRVYSRFVIVVMLALSLLASIGLGYLLRGRPWPVRAAIVVVVGIAVVRLEFWPAGRFGTNPIRSQPIYSVLAQLPDGIVAQYPVDATSDPYSAIFDQHWHGKPILNGFEIGSPEEQRAMWLEDPSASGTARDLAALGVQYVYVPTTTPAPIRLSNEYPRVARDSAGAAVYGVRPRGRELPAAVFPTKGFGGLEKDVYGRFASLTSSSGTLEVDARCDPCAGTVRFKAGVVGPPRTVEIQDPRGYVLYRRKITVGLVSFPLRFSGQIHLKISTDPGPIAVQKIIPGSGDTRHISINVRHLSFVPGAPSRR